VFIRKTRTCGDSAHRSTHGATHDWFSQQVGSVPCPFNPLPIVLPTVFLGELIGRQQFLARIGLDDVDAFLLDIRQIVSAQLRGVKS
jgi:hypothetical protein